MSQKIREAMADRGLSQADICSATGMQPTLLARMLRDDEHNYTVKTLSRIAAALETDLTIEFGNEGSDCPIDSDMWAPLSVSGTFAASGVGGPVTTWVAGPTGPVGIADKKVMVKQIHTDEDGNETYTDIGVTSISIDMKEDSI